MSQGTPKSLRQAIFHAFEAMGMTLTSQMMDELEARVKDYLAQKFTIAHMSRTEGKDQLLCTLYNSIVSSPAGKDPTGR